MTRSRRYAAKSYIMSTLWLSPLIACVLAQLTYRVPYVLGIDPGAIPGFVYTEQGGVSALDIDITMDLTAFIVFDFLGSMLVAIEDCKRAAFARGIVTALLRDNTIRIVVGMFAYELAISLGASQSDGDNPGFRRQCRRPLGSRLRRRFSFPDRLRAARLLRPLSIVRRMADRGLKEFADVYPGERRDGSQTCHTCIMDARCRRGAQLCTPAGSRPFSRSISGRWLQPRRLRRYPGTGAAGRRLRRDRPATGRARWQRAAR